MSPYETITFEQSGEVVIVTLNRPKLNLFNNQMMEDLIHAWHSLRKNTSARFVILTAQGDHFSAGADLEELSKGDVSPEDARLQQLAGHELMRSLENLEQITVAALRGAVCGAGMAVAQACDFRIMTENSFYILPETNIGVYYTWGSTPRLVRMVGASRAMEIIMTCEPISAQQAYQWNLANKIVPEKELMTATHEFIGKIMSKSPDCIRITKKIALGASMEGFGNMFVGEPEFIPGLVYSGQIQDGVGAFLKKKKPR
jgi:enoyl-CoA hydratase/carnithine racemase